MAAPVFDLYPQGAPPPVEEPNQTEIIPGPSAPLDVARVLLAELVEDNQSLLRRWRGGWWRYEGPHWVEAEGEGVRKWLYERLEHAAYEKYNPKTEQYEILPWHPTKGKIDQVLDAMTAPSLLAHDVDAPCWLDTGERATQYIACQNGLLDVRDQSLIPMTPRFFGLVSVPFEFDAAAPAPTEWLTFLRQLWPAAEDGTDADEVHALQEWFGYVLSGRMDLQKILLLVGPPRSGKGTIARILTRLMGTGNVAAPTLASLGTNFGLQPLLGRPLAIIGDARLGRDNQNQVVERLLSISGEDMLTVDRKNQQGWSGKIPSRIMILSNELPRFGDASGAIAGRFVVLTMEQSFLGKEDVGLEDRILAELPAILKWALEGLVRLREKGRMTTPAGSRDAIEMLADLVSPTAAFVREACVLGRNEAVGRTTLFRAWQEWCEENGHHSSSIQKFSTDLNSASPQLKEVRPKVNGVAQPREWRGISLDPDWSGREKELDAFQQAALARADRDRGGY